MKRVIKIILPSILMLLLIYLMRNGKDIIVGIYLIFPIIYIMLGIMYQKKQLLITQLLITISFLIPINLLFHMGSCIDIAFIYNILSIISYLLKNKIKMCYNK